MINFEKCRKCANAGHTFVCSQCGGRFNHFEPIKPQTNADHIRSMTDEELAHFHLLKCPYIAGDVYGDCKYGWHDREQSCEECMLDWLKQPYKEDT